MAIVTLEDRSGSIDAVFFPKTYQNHSEDLIVDEVLIVQGFAEISSGEEGARSEDQIRVNRAFTLTSAFSELARQIGISFPTDVTEKMLYQTRDILERFPGKVPVTLIFDSIDEHSWRIPCGDRQGVAADENFLGEIRSLLGENSIRLDLSRPKERA